MGQVSLPDGAGDVRVVAGELHGVKGPAKTFSPVTLLDIHLRAGARVELPVPARHNVAVLVMKGALSAGGETGAENELVLFDHDGESVVLEATSDGTMLSQNAWLAVLRTLGTEPWFGGSVFVSGATTAFDEAGTLTDERTRTQVQRYMTGFVAFAQRPR